MDRLQIAYTTQAYNEEASIGRTLEHATSVLQAIDADFVIIVVDDGSTDTTAAIVTSYAAQFPGKIVLVQHPKNAGYGAAVRTALQKGLQSGKAWIFNTDADEQIPVAELKKAVPLMTKEPIPDIIVGYRTQIDEPLIRRINSRGWSILSRLILGVPVHDVDCDFKLFHRAALATIMPLTGQYATVSPEIFAKAKRHSLVIAEIPVHHQKRSGGAATGAKASVILHSLISMATLRWQLWRDQK